MTGPGYKYHPSARRRDRQRLPICPNYTLYERLKAQWLAVHPGATQTEYDCAMQRIARECGV